VRSSDLGIVVAGQRQPEQLRQSPSLPPASRRGLLGGGGEGHAFVGKALIVIGGGSAMGLLSKAGHDSLAAWRRIKTCRACFASLCRAGPIAVCSAYAAKVLKYYHRRAFLPTCAEKSLCKNEMPIEHD
jgi:hypothetical protein